MSLPIDQYIFDTKTNCHLEGTCRNQSMRELITAEKKKVSFSSAGHLANCYVF